MRMGDSTIWKFTSGFPSSRRASRLNVIFSGPNDERGQSDDDWRGRKNDEQEEELYFMNADVQVSSGSIELC